MTRAKKAVRAKIRPRRELKACENAMFSGVFFEPELSVGLSGTLALVRPKLPTSSCAAAMIFED